MPKIDVDHGGSALQAGNAFGLGEQIGQPQLHTVRLIHSSVVKHDKLGKWKGQRPPGIEIQLVFLYVTLVKAAEIEQSPKRHVRIPGALGLV